MSSPSGLPPASLIGGSATRPWRHIPGDHRRREADESFDIFWDDAHQFGMVYPRATDARETLIYYETTDDAPYYTHERDGRVSEPKPSSRFLPRVLVHLAWRVDRSSGQIEQELGRLCPRKSAAILDAGCGKGECLAYCRERGHTVMGFEPDPVARESAQAQGLDVYDGSCERLPAAVRDRLFDVIICRHALHHIIDPQLSLRNLADRLVSGGRLICEVPNQQCVAARWYGIAWGALDVPRQLNVFTAQSLTHMIEDASLRIEKVEWLRYCSQFNERSIVHQRSKYDFFTEKGSGRADLPVKPTVLSRCCLLARTMFAAPESKYGDVRVVAQKP